MKKEHDECRYRGVSAVCVNPCSNGMKKEQEINDYNRKKSCFNPCSNGMKKEHKVVAQQVAEKAF